MTPKDEQGEPDRSVPDVVPDGDAYGDTGAATLGGTSPTEGE